MAKFDRSKVGAHLNAVTSMRTNPEAFLNQMECASIQLIPIDDIYPNELNKKHMEGVPYTFFQALADSILNQGLLQNLVVVNAEPHRKRLLCGEKRLFALKLIPRDILDEKFPKGIPCKVIEPSSIEDENDERIYICTGNVLAHGAGGVSDPEQLRELIFAYTQKGIEKNDMLSYLQDQLTYSPKVLQKIYKEATSINELRELYNEGKINLSAFRALAQDKPEKQKKYYEYIKEHDAEYDVIDEPTAYDIKRVVKATSTSKVKNAVSKERNTIQTFATSSTKGIEKLKKVDFKKLSPEEKISSLNELKKLKEQIETYIIQMEV